MEVIERLRKFFFQRALKKDTYIQGTRKAFAWADMKNIQVVYDATNSTERDTVLQYVERLRQQGKTVKMLAFINDKLEHSGLAFPHFTLKDLTWYNTINKKATVVDEFLAQKPDLLISLFSGESLILTYVSMKSKATYKIAPLSNEGLNADLMFKSSSDNAVTSLIKQIEIFVDKIKNK